MKIIEYNKLVRDKIPELIWQNGEEAVFEVLQDEDYLHMVDEKLNEELREYHKSKEPEELADLLEVIYAAAQARGVSRDELDQIRARKAEERGAFEKRILLKSVIKNQ